MDKHAGIETRQILSDTEFEKLIRGDVAVFEKVVALHEKLVYNIALRMTGSTEDASDISQECFVKLFKNIRTFNDAKHIRNWLCRVVHNLCIDELRKRGNRPTESLDDQLELEDGSVNRQISDGSPGPEDETLRREMLGNLERAIDHLSDEFKMIVVMRDIHGLSYQEICEAAQLEMGTVKSRLSRARLRLKQLFLREQSGLTIVKTDNKNTKEGESLEKL